MNFDWDPFLCLESPYSEVLDFYLKNKKLLIVWPTHSPSQSGQVCSLCNIDTHYPSALRSIAAATAYIQRRTLLHLKKKEVMKLPEILATCVGEIRWTHKNSNQ